ncbi:major facilitator superfamily domain-containing protein [Haematococcus lacustris]
MLRPLLQAGMPGHTYALTPGCDQPEISHATAPSLVEEGVGGLLSNGEGGGGGVGQGLGIVGGEAAAGSLNLMGGVGQAGLPSWALKTWPLPLLREQRHRPSLQSSVAWEEEEAEEEEGVEEEEGSESDGESEMETAPARDMVLGEALRTWEFWALFLQFMSGSAAGLTLLNNIASLVMSLGGVPGGQVAFVSLFSVANAAGRLLFGHLSEHALHAYATPRPVFLLLAGGLTACSSWLLASGVSLRSLYAISLMSGCAFGGHWALVPATASDLFGMTSFASVYSTMQFAPCLASFGFATLLAGSVLATELRRQGGPECVGTTCFGATFAVVAGVNAMSLGTTAWLWRHTRQHYGAVSQP